MLVPVFTYTKDPLAYLDYSLNWATWLGTDTIVSSTWIVPAGLASGPSFIAVNFLSTTIWLGEGVDLTPYIVTNQITTAAGRVDDRSIRINVQHR